MDLRRERRVVRFVLKRCAAVGWRRCVRLRDETENALHSFLRAVECDPLSLEAHRNLAEIYDRAGRKRDAMRHLSAIHRLGRDHH